MRCFFLLILTLITSVFVSAQQRSYTYGDNASVGHYAQASDARIYYEVYGEGDPLIVLHGGQVGSTAEMSQFIDSLRGSYQVIAVSTRGHGKSEIGHSQVTLQQRADDVVAVLSQVTNKPAIVLGFSDGAYTGYSLAASYPEKVKKLIAIGAGENLLHMRKVPLNNVEQMKKAAPQMMEQKLVLMPEPDRLQEYWNNLNQFYNTMLVSKELYGKIQCPVLVIAGELDPNAPLDTVINAYKMIPNAQLAIIAKAGHLCFYNNFPATWANIKPFLNE